MTTFAIITPQEFFASEGAEEMCRTYAAECANPAFNGAPPDYERYEQMHRLGLLEVIAAKEGNRIVGVAAVTVYKLPHYAEKLSATMESIFLLPEYRRGTTGIRLIRECLENAKSRGASGLYISAIAGSRLERLADRIAKRTNAVFFME